MKRRSPKRTQNGVNKMADEQIRMVEVKKIVPPLWNSRTALIKKNVDSIAESFQLVGQEQPIKVEELTDGSGYRLVFGMHRVQAARDIGWTTISAIVIPERTALASKLDNINENMQREDLTPFQAARSIVELRDIDGMKNKDAATHIRSSVQNASNLYTAYKGLPPKLLKAWEKNEDGASADFFRILVGAADKLSEEKREAFMLTEYGKRQAFIEAKKKGEVDADAKLERGLGPKAEKTPAQKKSDKKKAAAKEAQEKLLASLETSYVVSHQLVADVLSALAESKKDGWKLAANVLNYVTGASDKIPGIKVELTTTDETLLTDEGDEVDAN